MQKQPNNRERIRLKFNKNAILKRGAAKTRTQPTVLCLDRKVQPEKSVFKQCYYLTEEYHYLFHYLAKHATKR